ncbi:MAG: hypothetical protein JW810_06245 [Sedimentisphaerales bacterium]|nr:hypothetical protein [Sedimentisphaerales bacterium]
MVFLVLGLILSLGLEVLAQWQPVEGKIMTRWARDVSPQKVWPEYPRPMMVRGQWQNLNGLWDYAICPRDQDRPGQFDGQILVPFAVESALSGVQKTVGPDQRLWYRRTFTVPSDWRQKQRILLHFEAVDWDAAVWINGKKVGAHQGGYDPFHFDITDQLTASGDQELVVSVWDPTDAGTQPRGKQVRRPRGIWYTSVTGIWQTVWLEPVPLRRLEGLKLTPDLDRSRLIVTLDPKFLSRSNAVDVVVLDQGQPVAKGTGLRTVEVEIPNARCWSPEDPFLYDVTITLRRFNDPQQVDDQVTSYFGMRKIEVKKDADGLNRLWLNNKVLFQYGPLDQGWWPDGLYTAPTDEALRYDLEILKKLGCNMLRKHVKVEPRRLYYWCDKLGLLVWQDMPSGDRYIRSNDPDLKRSPESARQFELELQRIIEALASHPSIVMWVPFNEGWGQYDTARVVDLIKQWDPTRLVDNASGWADRRVGDVHDVHRYPGPGMPAPEEDRAAVLGEFGGLGLPLAGHTWQEERNWGYRSFSNQEELTRAYVQLIAKLRNLISAGLSAAVYTQTTDVEIEVNGWMTYDRAVIKLDPAQAAKANLALYLPPPIVQTVVASSQAEGQPWRYTTETPPESWYQADFDDSGWQQGQGGFGTTSTPGAVVRTEWNSNDIWIRRTFNLGPIQKDDDIQLSIHHDEDAEVYINGQRVAELGDYTTDYINVPLDAQARGALRAGANVMAVHCRQSRGGQYIDVGLVKITERR